MKKIWNHSDPLDFENMDEGDAPETAPEFVSPQKRSVFGRLYSWIFKAEEEETQIELPQEPGCAPSAAPVISEELRARREQIQQALNDWKTAAAYFENVVDPELVDYAVYGMEAAQKRYIYLLRAAGKDSGSMQLPQ